jgi:hypothetical protein
MYGNTSFGDGSTGRELNAEQRKVLRQNLSQVAQRTRELLPGEFVVGSELTEGTDGTRATVAVQPPIGAAVSADYVPEDGVSIDDTERNDIAAGLAASAALQVKQAIRENTSPTAK